MSGDSSKDNASITPFACAECGIVFGLDPRVEQSWRENHHKFFCPNGHSLSFQAPSETQLKMKALEEENVRLSADVSRLEGELANAKSKIEETETELALFRPRTFEERPS